MNLLRSISTIAGSSVISQVIGATSIWLISHKYNMAEVGRYALIYSIILIGAQVCTFASQLLIPRQTEDTLAQNVVFCLLQSLVIALLWAMFTSWIFHQNVLFLYLLTLSYAWVLVAENLSLRTGNYRFLVIQRIAVAAIVMIALMVTPGIFSFYWLWTALMLVVIPGFMLRGFSLRQLRTSHFSWTANAVFFREHRHHIIKVGTAEVMAMVNSNLPVMLINFWFSALTAGYFSVVSRFCLSPVSIVGNAVRNTIFSRWSMDFRQKTFNYVEYKKIRFLLFSLGIASTLGVFIFYPLVMHLGFSQEWINSIPTSRYMLPYLFPALAISPLTVIELIFGSHRYFLRIQLEQLAIILFAFLIVPWFGRHYAIAMMIFSSLTFIRYLFILVQMNKRAALLGNKAAEQ